MAVCIFWLLTYVGQGLDMAVGNRPVIIVQGGQEHQDYRHGNSLRKKSELSSLSSNLLHLRIYPSEGSQRDELSNWLLLNEEPRISSWTSAGILIDDIMREPRDFQTVFFALSPTVLNVLYSDYVTSQSQQQQQQQQQVAHQQAGNSELLYDDPDLIGQHQQRAKKLRIDCKHSRNTVSLPILVCDETGRRQQQHHHQQQQQQQQPLESRQSNYEENLFEQRLSGAKTDPKRGDVTARDYQNAGGGGGGGGSGGGGGVGVGAAGARGFLGSKAFVYDSGKLPGKRNHIGLGRRSVDLPHSPENDHHPQIHPQAPPASIASQFMLRSTRGSLQYDIPQIECPVSEDGMERFACPTADRMGRYHCIDDHVLCDGFVDCPEGEDEDGQACMFYKTTKAHLDVLADAILRWANGR